VTVGWIVVGFVFSFGLAYAGVTRAAAPDVRSNTNRTTSSTIWPGWGFDSARSGYNGGGVANYGQGLFLYLLIFQMVLLTFITPALTAGAISSEREHQTIDLLFVTRIPAFSILWGKLVASMSFVLLLLLLSVPIFSLVFLFGGIELDQVLVAFLVTAVSALTLGIIGIACSTAFRRTLPATVAAYGAAFVLLAGSLLYGLLFPTTVDPQSTTVPAPPALTYLSPIIPLVTIATNAPISGYGVRNSQGGGGFSGVWRDRNLLDLRLRRRSDVLQRPRGRWQRRRDQPGVQ